MQTEECALLKEEKKYCNGERERNAGSQLRDFYKSAYMYESLPYPHEFTVSGKIAGAIYAVSAIEGAIPILHGSKGCGFHYRYLCRRSHLPSHKLQCTDINEKDIIMGGREKLRATILAAYEEYHPAMIVVIPSTTIDMIHDDVECVLEELRQELECLLLFVPSEKISHADKRARGQHCFCHTNTQRAEKYQHDGDLKSCGFSEAMKAMVCHVMQKQQKIPSAVNICGLWGKKEEALINGLKGELSNFGVNINACLPECSLDELRNAPRAALNITTRRVNWAVKMKEIYGTDFLSVDVEEYSYSGLDGIEALCLEIINKLGLPDTAIETVAKRKSAAYEKLLDATMQVRGRSCVICCTNYRSLGKLIRLYRETFGFDIKMLWIIAEPSGYTSIYSPETLDSLAKEFVDTVLDEFGVKIPYMINPANRTLKSIEHIADYIVGDEPVQVNHYLPNYISRPRFIPLDFDNFVAFAADYADNIHKKKNSSISLPYTPLFRHYNQKDTEKVKKMWDLLWIQRGQYGMR